jgi:hippurate hydrolase
MAVINRIADYAPEMPAWRRHLHQMPELGFNCHKTATFVVEKLKEFGVDEIHEGIATSGVVAIINGTGDGPTMGLRADMDALPIKEATGADYASQVEGAMHACGHDGHTTMLLGAARYLAETRNFAGRVALIFQPAEEDGGGADVMVKEGIMERFDIARVFALHNAPNVPEGHLVTTPGPIMAAVDTFTINVKGKGGHAAQPQNCVDPVVASCGIVMAIQTILSRNHHALDDLVVSVTQIHTGSAENIIPDSAYINGTVRSFDPDVQNMVERRLTEIVQGQAIAYGVEAELDYFRDYPPTVNDAAQTAFAADVARDVVGDAQVDDSIDREMGAEDFAYMLQARPGSYLFLGQGDGPVCHHPAFDFNDEIAPIGASYFVRLVETGQPRT